MTSLNAAASVPGVPETDLLARRSMIFHGALELVVVAVDKSMADWPVVVFPSELLEVTMMVCKPTSVMANVPPDFDLNKVLGSLITHARVTPLAAFEPTEPG